tara:strand:- start:305 stop:610 length:306 start_codon:yes stop_codon:yes gene_type:complete
MTFKEYVEGRVSKENLERDLETYKGESLEWIYCHLWEFWTLEMNKNLYKIELAKVGQTIYVASDSEERAIAKVKSNGNEHRVIDSIENLTKSHVMFIIDED